MFIDKVLLSMILLIMINQFINNYSINKCTSIKNKKIITIDNLLIRYIKTHVLFMD